MISTHQRFVCERNRQVEGSDLSPPGAGNLVAAEPEHPQMCSYTPCSCPAASSERRAPGEEHGESCLAAATSTFRGEAAHTARGRHPSQVRFPLELRGHIPMFSFQVLKPSVLPFPTAKEWEQTPGGLCVRPWGARVAAGSHVEPGAVCAEVGGSPLEGCCTCRMGSYC